ncbi:MAG: fatty acid desaturase [Candidatus Acidiferrum sp.]|jgi:fatty acid desaturase
MTTHSKIASLAENLSAEPYRSIPRIFLDLLLWAGLAAAAIYFQRWGLTAICIFVTGFGPLHDLLVQGHEGTHDLISRNRRLNDFFTWFTLAIAGISAEAHRRFHLDHHHYAHSERDPEYRFFDRVVRGVPGWAYFFIPMFAQMGVNAYGLQRTIPGQVRRRIVMELGGAVLLHAAIAFVIGWRRYLLFVVAPMVTGLYVASVLRSVTEHHDVSEGSEWTNARSIVTHPVIEFLWSNVNYHLEHHLYPSVPYHALPKLREALSPEFQAHHSNVANGYGRTAVHLLKDPQHFASK